MNKKDTITAFIIFFSVSLNSANLERLIIPEGFDLKQYGALPYDTARYPLYAVIPKNFDANKPPDPSNSKDNKRWSSYGTSLLEKKVLTAISIFLPISFISFNCEPLVISLVFALKFSYAVAAC